MSVLEAASGFAHRNPSSAELVHGLPILEPGASIKEVYEFIAAVRKLRAPEGSARAVPDTAATAQAYVQTPSPYEGWSAYREVGLVMDGTGGAVRQVDAEAELVIPCTAELHALMPPLQVGALAMAGAVR